jgi:hypothetical protein
LMCPSMRSCSPTARGIPVTAPIDVPGSADSVAPIVAARPLWVPAACAKIGGSPPLAAAVNSLRGSCALRDSAH